MTPPSHADTSSPVVSAAPDRAPQVSAPVKKAPAKRTAAKKTPLKAVTTEAKALGKRGAAAPSDVAPALGEDVVPAELEDISVEELAAAVPEGDVAGTDVVVEIDADELVVTVGKKLTLEDVDDNAFEPAKVAPLEKELVEDQGFVLSAADDADEPEQQVMVAGATADPV